MTIIQSTIDKCSDKELRTVLQRLKKYEKYCTLLESDLGTYVKIHDVIGDMPSQLKAWLKLFNGGNLFTTSMLSTKDKEKGKINRLLTFSGENDPGSKKQRGIPQPIMIFAKTNFGNCYCFVAGEGGECVYEWDMEEEALVLKWNNFAEWLNEQIDFAETLINDKIIEPVEDQ